MGGVPDAYAVLQVDPGADQFVIQAAYHALARRYHPDGDAPDSARMATINEAYRLLRDPESRRRHDAARMPTTVRPIPVTPHPSPVPPPVRLEPWHPPPVDFRSERAVLDFGRYRGWRITELARQDPDYLRWLSRHSSGIRYREAIARVLPREPDLQRRASSVA